MGPGQYLIAGSIEPLAKFHWRLQEVSEHGFKVVPFQNIGFFRNLFSPCASLFSVICHSAAAKAGKSE
jgi:hypothetical protein